MNTVRFKQWFPLLAVTALAALFFALQLQYLHIVACPYTDEGIHSLVGRLILDGKKLYQDFTYGHPPGLPLFIGIHLELFDAIYPARVVYLFLNCFCIIPLYFVVARITGSRWAGIVGACFYISYHEMMHHDGRFLALRQLSNVLLIAYLCVGVLAPRGWKGFFGQTVLALLNLFTLFLSGATILVSSLALIFTSYETGQRLAAFKRYLLMGLICLGALTAFFVFVPGSFENTVTEHFVRPRVGWHHRWHAMFRPKSRDFFLFCISICSLLVSSLFLRRMRAFSLASLFMIVFVYFPREFFYHYFVIAAPALAFGAAAFFVVMQALLQRVWVGAPYVLAAAAVAGQMYMSTPGLFKEWRNHKSRDYYEFIEILRRQPEPFLTFF